MDTGDFIALKGKIVKSVIALTSRTFLLQLITFVSTLILTIILSPSYFGIFFVVSAIISFLSYFSDIGFAAALIQKKKDITRSELTTVFTVQLIIVSLIVAITMVLVPSISSFYTLDNDGIFLLKSLLIAFFLSSLKTIPSVLLERKLEFSLFVIPQIIESSIFYIISILLAFLGFGVKSFGYAALARGVFGLLAIYIISPWQVSLGISKDALLSLLKYGIPFQTNSVLALIKDDLLTIFLGKVLPFSQVGYIGWAKKWAEAPLRLIMDNIIRVTFPAFARLQEDKNLLKKAIEKAIFFLAVFTFPATLLMINFASPLIKIIPKYAKWEPALPSFYLFAVSSLIAAFASPLVNALNAIGKIKMTLLLMIMWTALTWLTVPLLVFSIGFHGYALSHLLIAITAIAPYLILKRFIPFNLLKPLTKPFISSLIMLLFTVLLRPLAGNFYQLIATLVISLVFYLVLVWFWMRTEIAPFIPNFKKLRINILQ